MGASLTAADEIDRELHPGETRLWTGRPVQGVVFRVADWFYVPFGALWRGWVILMFVSLMRDHDVVAKFVSGCVGVFFVLGGFLVLPGRFWLDAAVRRRTAYGLTSRRILIVYHLFGRRVISLDLATMDDLSFIENRTGGGVITFRGSFLRSFHRTGPFASTADRGVPHFDLPADARAVYERIHAARAAAAGQIPPPPGKANAAQ